MTANLATASFKAIGGTASRSLANHVGPSVNILNFSGVVGDNSTDCTTGIQAAIDYAATVGLSSSGQTGCEVFIPAGDYVVSAPLKNNTSGTSIRIRGAGRTTTRIHGSFTGWVIDTDDTTSGNIAVIEGLNVQNYRNNADAGGIRFNNSQVGVIRDCTIGGFNGVEASSNAYNSHIEGCDLTPTVTARTSGTVGIHSGQFGIYNCSLLGWDDAIVCINAGLVISGSRTESSNRGIVLNGVSGFAVIAHTTERCGTAIDIVNASNGVVAGGVMTGTVAGATLAITSITRSGGTATVTTTVAHGLAGTALLTIAGAVQTDYNGQYLCTITGASTFTYTVANSPTTPATGTITYINAPSYGIRVRNVTSVKLDSVGITCQASVAGIDMGSMIGTGFVLDNIQANISMGVGSNWVMPSTSNTPTFYASSVQFRHCNNPTAAFPFSNLPASPIEGMIYDISDSNTSTWGATAAGSGSNHVRVRYNGTNWTVVGK